MPDTTEAVGERDVEIARDAASDSSRRSPRPSFDPSDRLGAWALVLGGSILVLAGATFLAAIGGFAVGVGVGWWLVVPALAAQVTFATVAWRAVEPAGAVSRAAVTLVVCWLLLAVAGAASAYLADTSVDGRHYQGESVRAIASGWNPVRDAPLHWAKTDPSDWTNSYPKAPWILEGTVLRVTGSFEAAKLVGLALLAAAALVAFACLIATGLERRTAGVLALVLALNPVATGQAFTHMVDGILSSLLIASIALGMLWVWGRRGEVVIPALACSTALLVNTKFTGAVLAVLVVAAVVALGGQLARVGSRLPRMLVALGACIVVSVLVLGFNPYVTNTLRHGNPLHPIYGSHATDVTAQWTTGSLRHHSSVERLAISLASVTEDGRGDPKLKIPLTFSKAEFAAFNSATVRVGGFGPLFSAGMLLALAGVIALAILHWRRRVRVPMAAATLLVASGCCFVSAVVMPDSFVARFAPQLWFAPLLACAALLLVGSSTTIRTVAWCTLVVLGLNALGVSAYAARDARENSSRQAASLARLRRRGPFQAEFGGWRRSEERRLRDAQVRFVAVSHLSCRQPLLLTRDGQLRDGHEPKGQVSGVLLCRTADGPGG